MHEIIFTFLIDYKLS